MMTSSYANLFGTTKKPEDKDGFPGDGGYSQMANQQQSTQIDDDTPSTPATTPTYAQMQRQGRARPAPPASDWSARAAAYRQSQAQRQAEVQRQAQQFSQQRFGGGAGSQMTSTLQQLLSRGLPSQSAYNSDLFNQLRSTQRANLEAEFGAARSRLGDEMASRGLSASTIGAGRYGDLAGQQARAMATADAELLQRAAETERADRQARDQMFLSLTQYLSALTPQQISQLMGQVGGGNG